jgi:hypothetical protein
VVARARSAAGTATAGTYYDKKLAEEAPKRRCALKRQITAMPFTSTYAKITPCRAEHQGLN